MPALEVGRVTMRSFLKKSIHFIWGSSQEEKPVRPPETLRRIPAIDIEDADIPRYPPFAKGLPATEVERVISTQGELIERIRYSLGINHKDFNALLLPVLENYAAFVHLLPASESHHHRGAGGLFRHGLEAAFAAAQASDGVIFAIDGTPRERRDNEPRWRLVSAIAGLLHDVGKPLSDMSITNKDGTLTWNPYTEFLFDWAQRNNVDRYFLRWRDRRHKRHEQFSLLTVDRIIPAATREYIAQPGPGIMEALLEAVSGTSISNPVTKLMMFADKESVQRDLKQSRLNVDEFAYGVPVERYVFDAIRRLVNSGRWTVNEEGAKVWYLNQGVFIAWKNIGDLYAIIDQDNIPGIPRDSDTLADILIERGFAIQNKVTEEGGEATYRYWNVKPDVLGISILMLRFDSHELVFTSEPPAPVTGEVNGERDDGGIASLPRKPGAQAALASDEQGADESNVAVAALADSEAESCDDDGAGVSPEEAGQIQAQADSIMSGIGMGDLSMFGAATQEQDAAQDQAETEPSSVVGTNSTEQKEQQAAQEAVAVAAPQPAALTESAAQSKSKPAQESKAAPAKKDPFASIGSRLNGNKPKPTTPREKPAPKEVKEAKPVTDILAAQAAPPPQPPQPPAAEPSPVVADAELALTDALEQFGDAGNALKALLLPPVRSAGKKGPAKMVEGRLVVPYPAGVRVAGRTGAVVKDLADCGVLELDDKGERIWSLGELRCIVMSKVVQQAYEEAVTFVQGGGKAPQAVSAKEPKPAPTPKENVTAKQTKPRSGGLPGTSKAPAPSKAAANQLGALAQVGAKAQPKRNAPKPEPKKTQSEPANSKVSSDPTQKQSVQTGKQSDKTVLAKSGQAPTNAKRNTKASEPKQNTTTARPPAPKAKPIKPSAPVAKPRAPKEPDEAPPYEPDKFKKVDPKAVLDEFAPAPISIESAADSFLKMMEKGEGRWLVGPVIKEGSALITSREALSVIQLEHQHLSLSKLRTELFGKGAVFEDKKIVYTID